VRRAGFDVALGAVESARRLRTALDPDGDWVGEVLRDAHARLMSSRAGEQADAGGLVVAIDKEHAERLRARLSRICGSPVDMVTSDTPGASSVIARFAAGSAPWLVSVLMVSEGVDVPRLRVGVYATTARTELFFRQVVGRFVRRTPAPRHQMSHVFLPSDPRLKALAAQIEEERDHALAPAVSMAEAAERAEAVRGEEAFRALWSSARRDEEILQTTQPGDALPLFGELPAPAAAPAAPVVVESAFERRERLRAERRALVASVARLTGEPHRVVNARVNKQTGVASVAQATDEQLEAANRLLEREARRLAR
jgi:superfamily II DNA or RNA helicase